MANQIKSLDELFTEHENEQAERVKQEMALEQAAWDALPQVEKDRIIAEREQRREAELERMRAKGMIAEPSDEEADEDEDEEGAEDEGEGA